MRFLENVINFQNTHWGTRMKRFKLSKKKIIILSSVSFLAISGAGCFMFYKHYENTKPVAQSEKVKVVSDKDNNVNNIDAWDWKSVITKTSKNDVETKGFDNLFLLNVPQITTKGNKEFVDGNGNVFQRNLIALLQSGQYSDINQAAALWTRNKTNYNFTSNPNLITASIGLDLHKYEKYLDLIKQIPIDNVKAISVSFAKEFKNNISNPTSGALIVSQMTSDAQSQIYIDNNSSISRNGQGGTQFIETRQYSKSELLNSKEKVSVFNTSKKEFEESDKLSEAFYSNSKTNSVYSVHIKSELDGEQIMYVIEDSSGNLSVYGLYSVKKNDKLESKTSHLSNSSKTTADGSDLNWDTLFDSLK